MPLNSDHFGEYQRQDQCAHPAAEGAGPIQLVRVLGAGLGAKGLRDVRGLLVCCLLPLNCLRVISIW